MRDTSIAGYCYPPNSSNRNPALLTVHSVDRYELIVDDHVVKTGNLHDLTFSDRVGSINRKVFFDSGTQFETKDNDAIDQLLARTKHQGAKSSTVNKLESSWTFAIASIVCTVLLVAGFFKFGLPAGAKYAAYKVPVSASEKMSDGALDLMDNFAFSESETPEAKQETISNRFHERLNAISDTGEFTYTLHFRSMNGIANAFALPSGDVVVTDALVEMATDDELDSVLLHEIGHVVQRHGLQGAIKGTTIAVLVSIALGDLSTVGELTTGLGTLYLQGSYTRAAEAEADDYALLEMERQNMDPIHFARVMQKLTSQTGAQSSTDGKSNETREYLTTHPSTASRIDKARERSKAFNAQ